MLRRDSVRDSARFCQIASLDQRAPALKGCCDDLAAGQLGCGLLLMAPFGLLQLPDEAPPAKAVLAIVALGALGSALAYVLYFALIARAGASRAILVTYLVPAFALVYGAVFLDEKVTASAVAGLVLILAGTTLATGVARLRRPRVAAGEGPA